MSIDSASIAKDVVSIYLNDAYDKDEAKRLNKLAEADPIGAINDVIDNFAEIMGHCAFPFPYNDIAGDGVDKGEIRSSKIDRLPTDEFKRAFAISYDHTELRSGKFSGTIGTRRSLLYSLGCCGIHPCSISWLEGAEARCLGMPRLGRTGDWGRGWLFINSAPSWEGAKSGIGFNAAPLLSPSEWRWAVNAGLIAKPWADHMGAAKWNWQAMDDATAATKWGGSLVVNRDFAKLGHAAHALAKASDVEATWASLKAKLRHISGWGTVDSGTVISGFGVLSLVGYDGLAFVSDRKGRGMVVETERVRKPSRRKAKFDDSAPSFDEQSWNVIPFDDDLVQPPSSPEGST